MARLEEVKKLQKIAGILKENVNEPRLKKGDIVYDKSKDKYFKIEVIIDTRYIFRYVDPETGKYLTTTFLPPSLPIDYVDKYLGDDFIVKND